MKITLLIMHYLWCATRCGMIYILLSVTPQFVLPTHAQKSYTHNTRIDRVELTIKWCIIFLLLFLQNIGPAYWQITFFTHLEINLQRVVLSCNYFFKFTHPILENDGIQFAFKREHCYSCNIVSSLVSTNLSHCCWLVIIL